MHKKKRCDHHSLVREAHLLGVVLAFSTSAYAADPTLSSLGQSGGLTIPSAFVLPQGTFEAQGNDYIDPRYGRAATGSQVYWAGIGLFPYVEVSGGLANYPADTHVQLPGVEHFVFRHLMANAKVQIPIFSSINQALHLASPTSGAKPITFVQSMAWYHRLSVRSH